MTKQLYVDPVSGSDSAPGDGSEAHPWRTIQKAFDSHWADTEDTYCNIIGDQVTCDAGTYLNLGHANTHWFVVRPYIGLYPKYAQAYKIANSNAAQTYVLCCTSSDSAKWRFENAAVVPTAGQSSLFWGNGVVTDGQFCDCLLSAGSTLGKVITSWDLCTKTRPIFTRTKFTSTVAVAGSAAAVFENCVDLLLDSCVGDFVGNGVYIGNLNTRPRVIGSHDPASGNYNQWVGHDPAHTSAIPLAIGTSGDDPLASRPTCVLVEGVLVVGDGYSHTLMLDADGCVCRDTTVFIGTGGPGGLGMVHKFGTGYLIHNPRVYSGMPTLYDAENHPGIYTKNPADKTQGLQHHGVLFKGVADVAFLGGEVDIECTDGFCFTTFNTSNATGYTGRACKNIAVMLNRIVTGGTSYAWSLATADPTGYLAIDKNDYDLRGSGRSSILGTLVAADTPANIRAAWAGLSSATYPAAWTENDSHAYPLPSAALVVAGTNRGDGVVGTYPTTAATQAAQLAADKALVATHPEYVVGGKTVLDTDGTAPDLSELAAAVAALPSAAGVAAAILAVPENKLITDADGQVTAANSGGLTPEQAAVLTAVGEAAGTLTVGERNAMAEALLDRADAIEPGKTLRQAIRIVAAVLAGKVSGVGSGCETFQGIDGVTDRVQVTVDSAGNRAVVTYE